MTLIEAIKSGKRIKRGKFREMNDFMVPVSFHFSLDDVLSDDWEIEEGKIELTAGQIESAIFQNDNSPAQSYIDINQVIIDLGFKS